VRLGDSHFCNVDGRQNMEVTICPSWAPIPDIMLSSRHHVWHASLCPHPSLWPCLMTSKPLTIHLSIHSIPYAKPKQATTTPRCPSRASARLPENRGSCHHAEMWSCRLNTLVRHCIFCTNANLDVHYVYRQLVPDFPSQYQKLLGVRSSYLRLLQC